MNLDYKPLVFIVDDIPKNIQILTNILVNQEYRVAFSVKGQEALELAKMNKPDLILLDIMMPHTDGFNVCTQLKAEPETRDIPIIFVTGKSHEHEISRAFECGAVDYIVKPFNSRELINRVKTHINLHLLQKTLIKKNEDLAKYKTELENVISQKDKFFSIIAHDLRGPFSGFLGLSEILVNEYDNLTTLDINEINKNMHNSAQNLYDLLVNLLTWANTQNDKIQLVPEFIYLSRKVDKILGIYKLLADSKNIQLKNQVSSDIEALTDSMVLDTLLRNLVGNAIKFTKNGGEIILDANKSDDEIIVSIQDNGVGMPKEKVEKLFLIGENISTLGTNKERGSGLGLQICKELLSLQGNNIWVESILGVGTTFRFTLNRAIY